jgi:ferredoxin-NADP reductase
MRDNSIPVIVNERDESCFSSLKSPPMMRDRSVRSILFAGATGAASIVGIAQRLASAGQSFEVHNFAQLVDREMLRDEIDALRRHGKVYHYFDLSHDLFAEKSAHAMSPARADTQIYCSGPPAFTDLIERQAREWVYANNVHKIAA